MVVLLCFVPAYDLGKIVSVWEIVALEATGKGNVAKPHSICTGSALTAHVPHFFLISMGKAGHVVKSDTSRVGITILLSGWGEYA